MGVYLLLLLAIVSEVIATSALKATDGFTRLLPSAIVVIGYGATFYLLTHVLRRLELSIVYATWSALGTAGVVLVGVYLYGDSMNLARVAGLALVIAGVTVLNLSGSTAH